VRYKTINKLFGFKKKTLFIFFIYVFHVVHKKVNYVNPNFRPIPKKERHLFRPIKKKERHLFRPIKKKERHLFRPITKEVRHQ